MKMVIGRSFTWPQLRSSKRDSGGGLYTTTDYTGIVRIKIIIIIIIKVGPLPVGLRALRGATLDNAVFMTGQGAICFALDIVFDKLGLIIQGLTLSSASVVCHDVTFYRGILQRRQVGLACDWWHPEVWPGHWDLDQDRGHEGHQGGAHPQPGQVGRLRGVLRLDIIVKIYFSFSKITLIYWVESK